MTNLDSILKSRHHFANKGQYSQSYGFASNHIQMGSWTIKKAKWRRPDASELWCWRRLLRITWTARRSNQSTLKEISPEYSLEGLMSKLKFQYFGHLIWRAHLLEKTDAGKGWRQKEKKATENEMVKGHHWLNGHKFEQTREIVKDRGAWCAAVHRSQRVRHKLATEQQHKQGGKGQYSSKISTP